LLVGANLSKDIRKKKIEVTKKRNEKEKKTNYMGLLFSGPSNQRTAFPQRR